MRPTELAADHAHQASRHDAEEAQEYPAIDRHQHQKGTAQIHAERKLKHHERNGAVAALPKGVAKDNARDAGVQAIVDLEPQADQQPGEHGKAE